MFGKFIMFTKNPVSEVNPDRFISVNIYWIRFFGQWFEGLSVLSILFWVHFLYRIFIWFMLTFFPVGGEIIYLARNGDDVGKVAEGLYLMLSEAYMFFKLLAFFYNREKIFLLIEHLRSDKFFAREPEHYDFIKKSIKRARMVSIGYITMCIFAIIAGCLMPVAENFAILPTNVEYPYINVMVSPLYEILYVTQIYYKTAVVLLDGALDTIMPAFIAQALGQLDILIFDMENMNRLVIRDAVKCGEVGSTPYSVDETGILMSNERLMARLKPFIKRKLGECIKHHISIIEYTTKIEDAFSFAAAIQFMLSGLVICLVGVEILSIPQPLKHPLQLLWVFFYFACMTSEIYMLCWFGDDLINKSLHLQNAAFNCQWFGYNKDQTISIKIFRERTKKPLALTAGKIFTLSLSTFTNLLKWSYNAFALMRNMKS